MNALNIKYSSITLIQCSQSSYFYINCTYTDKNFFIVYTFAIITCQRALNIRAGTKMLNRKKKRQAHDGGIYEIAR